MEISIDDASQRAGLVLLAAFLVSFAFIRMSTRLMRSPKVPWWPGSIKSSGGVHVHHLVFGILLMIAAGFVAFAVQPEGVGMDVLAALFGIGVGLTVDEFALWLYLEDVYWTDEGRASVDVAIVCALLGLLVVVGFGPFSTDGSAWVVALGIVLHLAWCGVVLAKGKVRLAVIGLFLPFVFEVAAIRLARPGSPWARRFYRPGSPKLQKAEARAARWDARRIRWLDRLGGTPHLERPRREPS
ncbi:MAG TPA: hypothetical protein VFR97_06615 [Capillimicrobium sp.]|nr:hypothetical protein [Capillimicrobium sp.]